MNEKKIVRRRGTSIQTKSDPTAGTINNVRIGFFFSGAGAATVPED